MNKLAVVLALGSAGAESFVQGGTLSLDWKDCGDASTKGKVSGLAPTSLTLGQKTRVTGSGSVAEDVSAGKIAISLKASIISKTYSGDVCTAQTFTLPLGVGSITYDGVKCPLAAGAVDVPVDILLSSALPSSLATAAITISATSTSGDKLLCMAITTAPQAAAAETIAKISVGDLEKRFKEFETMFEKKYASVEERLAGMKNFAVNLERIALLASMEHGDATYSHLSPYADISGEEFSGRFGFKSAAMPLDAPVAASLQASTLPDSFDWRSKNGVNPVKNQGGCGSCWAFATVDNIEGAGFVSTGKLLSLSEQELVDCDRTTGGDAGCKGGLPSNAYKYMISKKLGLETESSYAYTGKDTTTCKAQAAAEKAFVGGWQAISTDENQIAASLMKYGTLAIGINAGPMQLYSGGIMDLPKFLCNPASLDHGVAIVGFGSTPKPYWIIRNSWGATWGEKGYLRIARGKGACGLNTMVTTATDITITASAIVV
jgi:cathepsin F